MTEEEVRDETHPYKQLIRAAGLKKPPCRIWLENRKVIGEMLTSHKQ